MSAFPTSQSALIRAARGDETQTAFAKRVGCDRSCLSRYEREELGAPTFVINFCLANVAPLATRDEGLSASTSEALALARSTVAALERLGGGPERHGKQRMKSGTK